jgi:hypothetical protein
VQEAIVRIIAQLLCNFLASDVESGVGPRPIILRARDLDGKETARQ